MHVATFTAFQLFQLILSVDRVKFNVIIDSKAYIYMVNFNSQLKMEIDFENEIEVHV